MSFHLFATVLLLSRLPTLQALPQPQTGGPEGVKIDTNGARHRALWPINGPTCNDITQTLVPDCFLAATLCVIADRFPAWLQSAVKIVDPADAKNGDNVDTAEFHLFNTVNATASIVAPNIAEWTYSPTHQDHWQSMNYANDIVGADTDSTPQYASTDMISTWWVAGFQNAAKKLFGNNYLDGGYPAQAMVMLANRPAVEDANWTQDEAFGILQHATDTVMTVATRSNAKNLVGDHAYAVMSTRMDGDTQMVTLHNPWGPTTEYKLSDIMPDIDLIDYLQGYAQLTPS